MTTTETSSTNANWRPARWGWPDAAILLVGSLLLFTGLGVRSLWHSEGRWAEITREMLLTGDFLHPTIGGEPYFDKPVGTYWVVAATAAITGTLNEWAARCPSALAGLCTIACTLWLGRRLWSVSTGRIAAALLVTTYGFLFYSRTANADMENVAAIMLALVWYWSQRDQSSFVDFLVFYLIVFIGALMKGLPAVIIPVLAVVPDIVMRRRWRAVLTPQHLLAMCVGLAVYFAPFVYASLGKTGTYQSSGLALVFRENVVRFFRPFDHTGPVYLYLYYLPVLLMPWAPLFIAGVVGLLCNWKTLDDRLKWLLWATGVIFVFFTASGSRRGYYILPLLPFCALLCAAFMVRFGNAGLESARRHGVRVQGGLVVVVILMELLGPFIVSAAQGRFAMWIPQGLYFSLLAVGVAACTVGGVAWKLNREAEAPQVRLFWGMFAGAAVLMGGFFCWQQDIFEVFRTERSFALELRAKVSSLASEEIAFYRNSSANMLFYMGAERPLPVLRNAEELQAFVAGGEKRSVITRRKFVEDACAAAPRVLHDQPDLAEPGPRWAAGPADDDWVAWIVSRSDENGEREKRQAEKSQ